MVEVISVLIKHDLFEQEIEILVLLQLVEFKKFLAEMILEMLFILLVVFVVEPAVLVVLV